MSIDYSDIGRRIRYFRTSKQISQEELAETAELSVTHISHIETGNTKLSLPTIIKIANSLSVSVDELLCDSIEKSKEIYDNEVSAQMEDCSVKETRIISEIVKTTKEALRKYQ
ncbi:hypothetical protein SDC9_52996 [bioreactor metagenome]|uniref:HTH cro/C1-type domain-containing protein n=1 Tax=bioreactor metagenome TaxID=1076179 RepID=A0A644WXC3_9ZZZZ